MNKKLIKQLKGVGFVKAKTTLNLKVKGGFICDFFMRNRMLIIYNSEKVSKKHVSCTFEGVLSLIKEHTGVDLAKKTKREEIEEIKVQFAAMQDAIKSQNKAIEGLKLSKPLEIVKEIAKLTLQLKKLEQNKEFEKGGVVAESKSNESVLSERTLKAVKKTVEIVEKQAVEMQAAEAKKMRGFEVDDRVVIKPSIIDESCCPLVASAAKEGNVYLVGKVLQDFEQVELAGSDLGNFSFCWIEHAPAESPKENALEFGKFAELLCDIDEDYRKGMKVLITDTVDLGENVLVLRNGKRERQAGLDDLKPL